MKKILIGLLALGCISAYAQPDPSQCSTQKFLASGNYLEKNFYADGAKDGLKIGACEFSSNWNGRFYTTSVFSNGLNLYLAYTEKNLLGDKTIGWSVIKSQSENHQREAIKVLRSTLLNCGCTKI